MLLLDEILVCDERGLRAAIDIGPEKMFCDDQGAPGWTGLEWMAQAAGAWLGARQLARGQAVDVGFLLGTRHYRAPAFFAPGRVHADTTVCLQDEASGMAVIDAVLRAADSAALLASARIKLFQPDDVGLFLDPSALSR